MTKEERDAVYSRCASIDNIIISMEREINLLRTHLDILTKVCEDEPQTERPCGSCQEFDCYGCEYKQTERSDK